MRYNTHVQGAGRVAEALRNGLDDAARVARGEEEDAEGGGVVLGRAKHGAVELLQVERGGKAPEVVRANGVHAAIQLGRKRLFWGAIEV